MSFICFYDYISFLFFRKSYLFTQLFSYFYWRFYSHGTSVNLYKDVMELKIKKNHL